MAQIEKGAISSITGNNAKVVTPNGIVTPELVITMHLRGAAGNLTKGTDVIYVMFDDRTGLVLERADGESY